ncbi:ArsR/SmtB family transcription factor [Methanogenium organophilum]|uniref:Winged helix-turn-helix domain-containing protein n=1 Tax=Methanogenium organophilum TaxID=2199 RepID=A0A9X9S4W4_METOG|nr:winged helix-turn-helix domain-containing protein [Methanogenium organophilum]WAI01581.1 winged helix-turn-helix domain-containing protein [Methanogenium organophilum]
MNGLPHTFPEIAGILGFLGNEQRLRILTTIARKEKFAREISEELDISRPLVAIYLKQLEKHGLVKGTDRRCDEPPYHRRYYRAQPFEFTLNLEILTQAEQE